MNQTHNLLVKQLAQDYCCNPDAVADGDNHFTVFHPLAGRRRFDEGDCFLKIVAVNGKLLCTGREDIIIELAGRLKDIDGRWFMESDSLMRLNGIIGSYGWRIGQMHPFYIAVDKTAVYMQAVEIKWYSHDEIRQFQGDARFDEAFAFCDAAPDVLAVAAIRNGEIIGMAGASADSPTMWQIGINVMPEAEGQGVGTGLVTLLKNAVLDKGVLPYYGTALSHIASQRVAIHSGFLPAWAELITKPL